jgi:hypothetical protein
MASELLEELPEECCEKCRFSRYDEDCVTWYCHRYPPSLALDECVIDLLSWPAIDINEDNPSLNWCGEFQPRKAKSDETPVESLGLSVRSRNALRRNNVHTIAELCEFTAARLLDECYAIGETSLQEIRETLAKLGKALKGDPPPPTSPA